MMHLYVIFMQVIDGNHLILGRASSRIAKSLLQGEEVHLVNAEKLIIIGNPQQIVEKYLQRRRIQHKGTPEFSPVWSKVPHMLVRRIVRGMLPWKSSHGKEAFRRLRVYSGNPKNLANPQPIVQAKPASASRSITIRELCRHLGYSG